MSKISLVFLVSVWALVNVSGALADTPKFLFPVSCTYGQDCWPVNYVDVDPLVGAATDYKCKEKTYDANRGTDVALMSVGQMRGGVDVLAAAAGRVVRVRDGEADHYKTSDELDRIRAENKDCGNGVLIDHGDGLQTLYCHLKQNSIVVKSKQKVKAGQKIAQVGMSGYAEFPRLGFSVLWEGGYVDPFTGVLNTKGCGQMKEGMWLAGLPVSYEDVVIFDGGFRAQVPNFEAIKSGQSENPIALPLHSGAFVFWAGFFNVEKDDEITMYIYDPNGALFVRQKEDVPQTRTRQYYFSGRKIGRVQLTEGTYKGRVEIRRDGVLIGEKTYSVRVQ